MRKHRGGKWWKRRRKKLTLSSGGYLDILSKNPYTYPGTKAIYKYAKAKISQGKCRRCERFPTECFIVPFMGDVSSVAVCWGCVFSFAQDFLGRKFL